MAGLMIYDTCSFLMVVVDHYLFMIAITCPMIQLVLVDDSLVLVGDG